MELLFNWKFVLALCGVSLLAVVGFMLVNDEIHHSPKWFQKWWKRHICDTEENLWPNG